MDLDFLNSGFIFSDFVSASSVAAVWVGWGVPLRSAEITQREGGVWVYAPHFFLDDSLPWWWFPQVRRVETKKWETELRSQLPPQDVLLNWQKPSREAFERTYHLIQQELTDGTLKKAVPVVFEKANKTLLPLERGALLLRLLESVGDSPLMLYGIWNESEGMLGATPELLFQLNQPGQIETMALAGTRKKGESGQAGSLQVNLLNDPKERQEHQIVIQGIEQSFERVAKRIGSGRLEIGETVELELPTLLHLHTPIRWSLAEQKLGTASSSFSAQTLKILVEELHPTPALGAHPREAGWQWLKKQRTFGERYRFGAPFGLILPSGEHASGGLRARYGVSIRNIQWNSNEVLLGAGCGIVPGSQLDREWAELGAKIQSVKKLFGWG